MSGMIKIMMIKRLSRNGLVKLPKEDKDWWYNFDERIVCFLLFDVLLLCFVLEGALTIILRKSVDSH